MNRFVLLSVWVAAALPAQQPNVLSRALLTFDLQNGPPWPVTPVALPVGQAPVTHLVELSGSPGAPFVVAGADGVLATGVPVAAGLLDLDVTSGFAIAADGLQDPFWSLGPSGAFRAPITIAAGAAPGIQRAFQGIVADPTSPAGATLTAATVVVLVLQVLNQALNIPGDSYVVLDLSPFGLQVPFYGTNYAQVFVNQNGSVSFTAGSGAFFAQPAAFLAAMPRIAGYWTDLEPGPGSSISAWVVPVGPVPAHVQINWIDMREWSGNGTRHSFAIRIFAAPVGDIQILHGPANGGSAQEILVGLSPGGNLSAHPQKDLSALSPATPVLGCPNENFHELFGDPGMPYYTGALNNPWDLAGRTLTFHPVVWTATWPACLGTAAVYSYLAR